MTGKSLFLEPSLYDSHALIRTGFQLFPVVPVTTVILPIGLLLLERWPASWSRLLVMNYLSSKYCQ